jgi:hypothetical protein
MHRLDEGAVLNSSRDEGYVQTQDIVLRSAGSAFLAGPNVGPS